MILRRQDPVRVANFIRVRDATRILVGTRARREARGAEACEALNQLDPAYVLDFWQRNRVVLLSIHRAREFGLTHALWTQTSDALAHEARERATQQELTAFKVTRILARDGIKAVTIKGPVMARQLYGDVALRDPSSDVDMLVGAGNLHRARDLLVEHGWTPDLEPLTEGAFPEIHFALWGPEGTPNVEMHWRTHWHDRYATTNALLARSVQERDLLTPDPEATVSLLYRCWTRDGLQGLRLPSDIAAWRDRFGESAADDHHAERLAASTVRRVIGKPAQVAGEPNHLTNLASSVVDSLPARSQRELFSRCALIDVLSAPAGQRVRRLATAGFRSPELIRSRYPRTAKSVGVPVLRLASFGRSALDLPRALRAARRLPVSPG